MQINDPVAIALTHEGCDIGAIKKRVWKTTPKINCLSFTTDIVRYM